MSRGDSKVAPVALRFRAGLGDRFPGLAIVAGSATVRVGPSPEPLLRLLACSPEPSESARSVMADMRELYWRTGVDPTKVRPSSEALRKAARKGTLRSIYNVVDACNAVSLLTGFPLSVFDAGALSPPLFVDLAGEDGFDPVSARTLRLRPGMLLVRDRARVVCAGYATSDAWDTRVTEDTREVIYLVYVPPGKGRPDRHHAGALRAGSFMAAALTKWCDGSGPGEPVLLRADG